MKYFFPKCQYCLKKVERTTNRTINTCFKCRRDKTRARINEAHKAQKLKRYDDSKRLASQKE